MVRTGCMSDSPNDNLFELIGHCIPEDHARQVTSVYYVSELMKDGTKGRRILDLGCGDGRSVDLFRMYDETVSWIGLDIESSPEVARRRRDDCEFRIYDGVEIPVDDASVDIVYSHQVFEHVRRPEPLLEHVRRVLKPGGAFIGSVSSLEPYHSFSLWNYTPYGWYVLLEDAGLTTKELRPGIDAIALIRRGFDGRPRPTRTWFDNSPLNAEIDLWATTTFRRPQLVNLRKLMYCGQIVFHAELPGDQA